MIRTTDETDDIEPVNHTADDSMTANYSKARLEECTNMVSKGIARAIDNKLSKVLIGSIDEKDNQVTVVNAKDLSYLYEAVVFAFELEDGSIAVSYTHLYVLKYHYIYGQLQLFFVDILLVELERLYLRYLLVKFRESNL